MSSPLEDTRDVYLLPLTDSGAPDVPGRYISLPPPTVPPYVVRFSIEGTSSICREGSLWVNLPTKGEDFVKDHFREFKLRPDFSRNIEISIPIVAAGAFAFYTTHSTLPDLATGSVKALKPTCTPTYYIDVSPRLTINGGPLRLDALSIISVLSKSMGTYPPQWEAHLHSIGRRRYNMIHFTPLMHRGATNSPYSIYDQLAFDPLCFPKGEDDIVQLVDRLERDHGMLALTDIVWNHTAMNSKWLEEHPEAGYNVDTAPWLESALELDTALLDISGKLASLDIPTDIQSEGDLRRLVDGVKLHVLESLKLWEYYVVDVKANATAAIQAWMEGKAGTSTTKSSLTDASHWPVREKADFLLDRSSARLGPRFYRKVEPTVGASLLTAIFGPYGGHEGNGSDAGRESAAREEITKILDAVNVPFYQEYDADHAVIVEQLFNRLKYLRLDEHGPRLGEISAKSPLIEPYFTRLPDNETTRKHSPKSLALVNNGWLWAADAMKDNAGPGTRAYLRREIIVWSDCVKLRYGNGPEDNPFLWDYMTRYTRLMAKHFVGFRIDNCHSTPLAVGEYLLNEARKVQPNLFVCAELFTGSEEMDYVFVERLGLNSLIREAMQAWGPGELSRLVHRHGGRPIGSFEIDEAASTDLATASGTLQREAVHRIKQTPVHALFMDCTHDNELPAQKRQARDTLPNAALVAMCACATGSVVAFDEIYPRQVDLVHDTRLYTTCEPRDVNLAADVWTTLTGIGDLKQRLNEMHTCMGQDGYDETFIHHEDQYITVHRVHPKSKKGYFLIARTAFRDSEDDGPPLGPVHLSRTIARQIGSWSLEVDTEKSPDAAAQGPPATFTGLPSRLVDHGAITLEKSAQETVISVTGSFPPGSIALFETSIPSADYPGGLDTFVTSGATEAFADLTLIDLNFVLYRCEAEERDSSHGRDGVYTVPKLGPLVYAGFQGWWSMLKNVIHTNDLGHPLCEHLRAGQWALDHVVGRLERRSQDAGHERLRSPAKWLRERFDTIRKIPSFLLPRYFALVIQTAYNAAWDRGISLMGEQVRRGQPFLQSLAMVSVQQMGYTRSASLYPDRSVPCLAAGLPHFASGWARCWGRDVFISLRGLLLGTGRYADAREHILAFASVLKHGMIPNLLSDGKAPRYNSRDSIWFFLQAIQDYAAIVPEGVSILRETVRRRFLPYDDTWFAFDDPRAYSTSSTVADVIQEALQRHATGLSFREANAGPGLDMQMRPEGFQIDVRVDWTTGLVFGGNRSNCGTWMDKMGESERANSKGVPGTPRDGAAIEITGLLYSTVAWLSKIHPQGHFAHAGVTTGDGRDVTYLEWASLIRDHFERCYYVPTSPDEDAAFDVNPAVVHRRGIYKDIYRCGQEYEDYQLRANFPIAMCVAPQLFDPARALGALLTADREIRGPTGMATLDPSDLNYRPYYNNSEDSSDFATSKGRNYHQGPEWVWPTGFFLRALLRFDLVRRTTPEERIESLQQITRRLEGCKQAIVESPWAGLTELTNKNGEYCADSSPTQAWSAGCLIDVFHDAPSLAGSF
ncbi:MAG: hypothetical protein M1838_005765 [Thelocarpon superellum]|nr:MAG: hypothetical protein M1838_005765 [Thelocarpon superellum]